MQNNIEESLLPPKKMSDGKIWGVFQRKVSGEFRSLFEVTGGRHTHYKVAAVAKPLTVNTFKRRNDYFSSCEFLNLITKKKQWQPSTIGGNCVAVYSYPQE